MAQSFQQLQRQIAELQAKATQLKQAEIKDVIGKIKVAITTYGLTSQDLFGTKATKVAGKRPGRPTGAKYGDKQGNTWGGRGKRPQWLRDALNAGAKLEDFLQAGGAPEAVKPVGRAMKRSKKAAPQPGKPQYRDEAGNSWVGRGPRPAWVKAALAAGKTLGDLRAK